MNITITILDIIHRLVFYLKQDVSKTGFWVHLEVKSSQVGPVEEGPETESRIGNVPF
jgi:hypothetical protein